MKTYKYIIMNKDISIYTFDSDTYSSIVPQFVFICLIGIDNRINHWTLAHLVPLWVLRCPSRQSFLLSEGTKEVAAKWNLAASYNEILKFSNNFINNFIKKTRKCCVPITAHYIHDNITSLSHFYIFQINLKILFIKNQYNENYWTTALSY